MSMITFNIEATMEEARVNQFCSMLKYMEHNSDSSQKTLVGTNCGGDSNFHPKFKIDTEFDLHYGNKKQMFDIDDVINIVDKYLYGTH